MVYGFGLINYLYLNYFLFDQIQFIKFNRTAPQGSPGEWDPYTDP